jgi:hypothetical protein
MKTPLAALLALVVLLTFPLAGAGLAQETPLRGESPYQPESAPGPPQVAGPETAARPAALYYWDLSTVDSLGNVGGTPRWSWTPPAGRTPSTTTGAICA